MKTRYFYCNYQFGHSERKRISLDEYLRLKAVSLRFNLAHHVSERVDINIFKDYYALDNNFNVWVEVERRY